MLVDSRTVMTYFICTTKNILGIQSEALFQDFFSPINKHRCFITLSLTKNILQVLFLWVQAPLTRAPLLRRIMKTMNVSNQLCSTILQQVFRRFHQILPVVLSILPLQHLNFRIQPNNTMTNCYMVEFSLSCKSNITLNQLLFHAVQITSFYASNYCMLIKASLHAQLGTLDGGKRACTLACTQLFYYPDTASSSEKNP